MAARVYLRLSYSHTKYFISLSLTEACFLTWELPCEKLSGHMRTKKAQISLHIRQSNKGLCCLLTDSLDTTECMNGEQRPG